MGSLQDARDLCSANETKGSRKAAVTLRVLQQGCGAHLRLVNLGEGAHPSWAKARSCMLRCAMSLIEEVAQCRQCLCVWTSRPESSRLFVQNGSLSRVTDAPSVERSDLMRRWRPRKGDARIRNVAVTTDSWRWGVILEVRCYVGSAHACDIGERCATFQRKAACITPLSRYRLLTLAVYILSAVSCMLHNA